MRHVCDKSRKTDIMYILPLTHCHIGHPKLSLLPTHHTLSLFNKHPPSENERRTRVLNHKIDLNMFDFDL